MQTNRRAFLRTSTAGLLAGTVPALHAQGTSLKIAHQFPGGTLTDGDFRDRLCRRFAAEVEKRTGGAIKASVYTGS